MTNSVGGPDAVGSATDRLGERLDQAFTHPLIGLLAFRRVIARVPQAAAATQSPNTNSVVANTSGKAETGTVPSRHI